MKVEIIFSFESDDNVICQEGVDCRVVVTRKQLFVLRTVFTAEGNKMYMERYMKRYRWSYFRKGIYESDSSQQQTETFKITSAVDRSRDVFVWISNDANKDTQTHNPFLYNTFNVANDRNLVSCQLEIGNGNKYPENEYKPETQMARVVSDVNKYSCTENEYQSNAALLNQGNVKTIFPSICFDLRNKKLDVNDGITKLAFSYKLSRDKCRLHC